MVAPLCLQQLLILTCYYQVVGNRVTEISLHHTLQINQEECTHHKTWQMKVDSHQSTSIQCLVARARFASRGNLQNVNLTQTITADQAYHNLKQTITADQTYHHYDSPKNRTKQT